MFTDSVLLLNMMDLHTSRIYLLTHLSAADVERKYGVGLLAMASGNTKLPLMELFSNSNTFFFLIKNKTLFNFAIFFLLNLSSDYLYTQATYISLDDKDLIMDSRNDLSSEPMEIDLSSQSVHAMDISCDFSDDGLSMKVMRPSSPRTSIETLKHNQSQPDTAAIEPVNPTIKYCHINLQRRSRGYKRIFFRIFFGVFIAFVSIATYYINNLKCCDNINFKELNNTLSEKLYGQSNAVNLLLETLEVQTSSKILFFSGGTGVGKTLTSSLLLEFIRPCSNVYHYTTATFENTFSPEMMYGITLCKSSVVVVDDVTLNNKHIKEQISNLIMKTNSLGKEITVILIYNCNENRDYSSSCDKLFNDKILENFSDVEALKKVIQFEPLSMKSLKQCIVEELGNRKLDEIEFESLLKQFNVSVDGCKGVHSKMKYLNIL